MTGNLGVAFGAGMLATVSPCGLAMLPAFLAYYVGTDATTTDGRRTEGPWTRGLQGLRVGVGVSLGFVAVFVLMALIVTAGLKSVVTAVPWFGIAVGVALVVLGVALLAGRRVGMTFNSSRLTRDGRGTRSVLAYGAAYAVASLSCSLGILLALVGQALSSSSTTTLLSVYVAFAAGNATILILLALSAAFASGGLAKVLKRSSRYVPRVAGGVVLLSGVYTLLYWSPALTGGGRNRSLAGKVSPMTDVVGDFFQAHTGLLGILALTSILSIGIWAVRNSRRVEPDTLAPDDLAHDEELKEPAP